MVVELINTGSELMLGRVLNTHQQWLCRSLADHGFIVSRQVAVPRYVVGDPHPVPTENVPRLLAALPCLFTAHGS